MRKTKNKNMNFYYDPILELKYNYLVDLFEIDLTVIPNDFNVKEFIKEWQRCSTFNWIPLEGSSIKTIRIITTDFI